MGLITEHEFIKIEGNKQGGGSPNSPQMAAGNAMVPEPQAGFVTGPGRGDWDHVLYAAKIASNLPAWGTKARDRKLRDVLLDSDNLLSSVTYGEVARIMNTSWTITADTDDKTKLVKTWHKKLNKANFGMGFRALCGAFAFSYLCQDNGVFFEKLVDGGRERTHLELKDDEEVLGIATLDSYQCYRTFDPEYPVVYFNPWDNQWYVYHYTKIVYTAQFDQNRELSMGMGLCALSRAYSAACLVKESHIYMYEKISGAEPEIIFVSGVGQKSLRTALEAAQGEAMARGATRYKGVVFIAPPSIGPNFPEVKTHVVGLKSVPDGWKHGDEISLAIYKIALAYGLDAREIWPATESGATKADSEVQDRKTSPKGRTEVMRALEYLLNQFVLPDGITFRFDDVNTKEQLEIERLRKARGDRITGYVRDMVISPDEARAILAAYGDIDRRLSPGVMDNDITEMEDGLDIEPAPIPISNQAPQPQAQPAAKEIGRTQSFFPVPSLTW